MSEAGKFARKLTKETVCGIEVELMPLGASDLDLMAEMDKQSSKEQVETTKEIIRRSIPDAKKEEINEMSLDAIRGFQDAIAKINNLGQGKSKEKDDFIEGIKEKQGLAKQ